MSGGTQPPFRMPCEGVAGQPRFFLGGLFSHAITPDLRDRYVNTTVVDNWNTDVGGTIPPYERWTPDLSGGDSCEVHHCVVDGAPCSQFLRPFTENTFANTPGDKTDFAVARKRGWKGVQGRRFWSGRRGYLYNVTGANASCCNGDGTITLWRKYNATVDRTKYLGIAITSEYGDSIYDYSGGGSPVVTTTTDTMDMSQSIDGNSGLFAFDDFSMSPNDDRNLAFAKYDKALWTWGDIIARMLTPVTPSAFSMECTASSITLKDDLDRVLEQIDWDFGAGTFTRNQYEWDSNGTQLLILQETVSVTNTELDYYRREQDWNSPDVGHGTPSQISETRTTEVSGILSDPWTDADIQADIKGPTGLLSLWPLNDNALYPWRTDSKVGVAPLVSRDELFTTDFTEGWWVKDYSAPFTDVFGNNLGDYTWIDHTGIMLAPDPNTGTARVAIGNTETPAGSDFSGTFVTSPFAWTNATAFTILGGVLPPGVSLNATTGEFSGICSADCSWGITVEITGAAPRVTGEVLGAPKPAGYENFWDFRYQHWAGCCFRPLDNPGFQTWSWYQVGWGGNVGIFNDACGTQLPLNATQWTNFFQAVNKPQGAFLFYNDPGQAYFPGDCISSDAASGALDAGALWAGKYAEALELWPSQNFARPAGDDKFAFDENKVFCAVNDSGAGEGSTWTLTDPNSGIAPPDDTDFSGVWGGPVVDGFYEVDDYSAGVLTLGLKAFDVPSNFASKSNGDEAFCFGKLRYPTYPALLGRVAITPDVAGTTFTFASAQPAFGMDAATHQEQVDLYDASMTLLAANVTATRVDDSNFTIPDAYVTARFVLIHGVKWYINDNSPKGDYLLLQWLADLRSPGEYSRLTGVLDCSSAQVTQPATNAGGGPVLNPFASFSQTPGCLPFVPCAPKVVCISPNGETWPNGITYDFPADFVCDEEYGSKWWAFVQSTMTDLFWQPPHRPCNIGACAKWLMDGGTCAEDVPGACPGDDDFVEGESEPPIYYFGHAPQVEARATVPNNYGADQDESAPALPGDVQIGWLSPVDYNTGEVAYPPAAPPPISDGGIPGGAFTAWDLHYNFCASADGGCRFPYQLPGC